MVLRRRTRILRRTHRAGCVSAESHLFIPSGAAIPPWRHALVDCYVVRGLLLEGVLLRSAVGLASRLLSFLSFHVDTPLPWLPAIAMVAGHGCRPWLLAVAMAHGP